MSPPTSQMQTGTWSAKTLPQLKNPKKTKTRSTSASGRFPFPPPSVFEPRVSGDGGFAAVSVVVQQLLALVDVSGGDQDEVRNAADVVEFGLAVPGFTVIYQPTQPTRLFGGVHAVERERERESCIYVNIYMIWFYYILFIDVFFLLS